MARSLNKVQLIGRLGSDPVLRVTSTGISVTTFSLATNRQWTGRDGALHEETDWHPIVAWDRLAQICSEHLSKGRLVFIEGRLRHREWEAEGQRHYRAEVVASDMLILDSRGAASELLVEEVVAAAPAVASAKTTTSRSAAVSIHEADPDDLPF